MVIIITTFIIEQWVVMIAMYINICTTQGDVYTQHTYTQYNRTLITLHYTTERYDCGLFIQEQSEQKFSKINVSTGLLHIPYGTLVQM